MKRVTVAVFCFLTAVSARAESIPIVVPDSAAAAEKAAAVELARHLGRLYPADRFQVAATAPRTGKMVLLGTPASNGDVRRYVGKEQVSAAESFVVATAKRGGSPIGIIAGADERGVLYGVYALLEKLGWGLYLSYEIAPDPIGQPFSFAGWDVKDAPVFRDRVIFDWHNFLSSASTWELDDWKGWIDGAARMRYNTVMVHAYGNNPMFTFKHNGQTKPVGYLATTRSGRDWGTQHVNDIRRLVGGEIFSAPVFGASVALTSEDERASAKQALVRQAFDYARERGLHVTFAVDVDTESANPQNIIGTLPESARVRSRKTELANPDTAEGYAYYKTQVVQLLALYPQIDRLVVWFRPSGTPWRVVTPEDFPAAWKREFRAALSKRPAMAADKNAPSMFAIGKIVAAFGRALRESGRAGVELCAGTWRETHLPAADVFFPAGVKLYWLDTAIVFDKPETQALLRRIPSSRPMLPIVWAHHDDRTYIGKPYTPFPGFASLVQGTGTGFGIIHWTTRPLDIYFKSLSEQVWGSTRNRPLKATAYDMAARTFGPSAADVTGEYLYKWITEGRMFGRETTDRFIDVLLADASDVIAGCRERLALLARVDERSLTPARLQNLRFFRDYEEFTADFFASHQAFEQAGELHKSGDRAKAREAIARSNPQRVIEEYLRASSQGRISRGEEALIISLNLRWAPYLLSLRQAVGLEPVRYKFGPTQHEPLAQGPGRNTFWVDARRAMWKQLGERETGAPAVADKDRADDVCGSGLRIERPLTLKLTGIMGDKLAPGKYRVETILRDGASANVEMRAGGAPASGRSAVVDVSSGAVELTVVPSAGTPFLCGVTLTAQ